MLPRCRRAGRQLLQIDQVVIARELRQNPPRQTGIVVQLEPVAARQRGCVRPDAVHPFHIRQRTPHAGQRRRTAGNKKDRPLLPALRQQRQHSAEQHSADRQRDPRLRPGGIDRQQNQHREHQVGGRTPPFPGGGRPGSRRREQCDGGRGRSGFREPSPRARQFAQRQHGDAAEENSRRHDKEQRGDSPENVRNDSGGDGGMRLIFQKRSSHK